MMRLLGWLQRYLALILLIRILIRIYLGIDNSLSKA